LKPVYCLIPVNGNRRTATKWVVGQLGDGDIWSAITDPMSKDDAEREEKYLRALALRTKKNKQLTKRK
jgi:hypothetical protein